MYKIEWVQLSLNPNAYHLFEKYPEKIDWINLSRNPNAIHLLEQNMDKIYLPFLSINPNALHLLCKLDTVKMREKCQPFAQELCAYVLNPVRACRIAGAFAMDLEEYLEMI